MGNEKETDSGRRGEVQEFYEHHPYPRPIESLDTYRDRWRDRQRLRADFHLFWPTKPFSDDHSILIAGCGTSQAAKHAIRWPNAKVTGIDFSRASLDETNDLKEKYKLANLTLHELPVERVGALGATFDQVVCTGVLHHLPDPDAGLAALRNVLKADGAVHLMVYAPYGRTGIYMMQEFCRRLGIEATDDGIRDLIETLKSLPPGHPLEMLLREAPDFRHEAAIADALLNPQDRAYSVPQLFEFLANGGMKFGRWLQQAPYEPECGVMAQIAQTNRLAELSPEEQYAAAELFRGTMVTHSVVAYRSDGGGKGVDLSGDWRRYIPIRMPDTICVVERLPEFAAAVLINRTHAFRDIYLPITAEEKLMFEAIDGKRSIGEIADKSAQQIAKAQSFFERLWCYDQIVCDAT